MAELGPTHLSGFGMDSRSLAGTLVQRLAAIRAAGFAQVMLSATDLAAHPDGLDDAVERVRASGLRVTGLAALRDYEGLVGPLHDYKLGIAKDLLELCAAAAAPLLLVCASTDVQAVGEPDLLIRDLRKLAMLALPLNVRIAYKAVSDACHVRGFAAAADIVAGADAPNLGLAIDALQALEAGTPFDETELLDAAKIFLVQLAEPFSAIDGRPADVTTTAGRLSVFPGEGLHSERIAELVLRLDQLGYQGDYSLQVDNDDYRQLPASTVAGRARRSALWLAEDVLHQSAPLPGRMRLRPV